MGVTVAGGVGELDAEAGGVDGVGSAACTDPGEAEDVEVAVGADTLVAVAPDVLEEFSAVVDVPEAPERTALGTWGGLVAVGVPGEGEPTGTPGATFPEPPEPVPGPALAPVPPA